MALNRIICSPALCHFKPLIRLNLTWVLPGTRWKEPDDAGQILLDGAPSMHPGALPLAKGKSLLDSRNGDGKLVREIRSLKVPLLQPNVAERWSLNLLAICPGDSGTEGPCHGAGWGRSWGRGFNKWRGLWGPGLAEVPRALGAPGSLGVLGGPKEPKPPPTHCSSARESGRKAFGG